MFFRTDSPCATHISLLPVGLTAAPGLPCLAKTVSGRSAGNRKQIDSYKRCVATVSLSTCTIELICVTINSQKTMNSHLPLLTFGCSSCTGRRGTVWPSLCCCLVWTSHCVYSPSCVALRGCWWYKPEPTRGTHCSVAVGSKTTAGKNRKQVSHCKALYEIMTFIHGGFFPYLDEPPHYLGGVFRQWLHFSMEDEWYEDVFLIGFQHDVAHCHGRSGYCLTGEKKKCLIHTLEKQEFIILNDTLNCS